MKYKIKNFGQGLVVIYECPNCQTTLRSPLEEAGQRFSCPECSVDVETPGVEELERHRSETKAREEERLQAEQRRLDQLAEEQAAREAAERKKLEERRRKAAARPKSMGAGGRIAVTGSVSLFTVILALAIFHQFFVAPLKAELRRTKGDLSKVTAVVEQNANELAKVSDQVDSNAETANLNQANTDRAIRLLSLDSHRHLR